MAFTSMPTSLGSSAALGESHSSPTESSNEISVAEAGVVVSYPLSLTLKNYPYVGGQSVLKVTSQLTVESNSCQLIWSHELSEAGLCESDEALSDFCFTEKVRDLEIASDVTCKSVASAQKVKTKVSVCSPRQEPLSLKERLFVQDAKSYKIDPQSLNQTLGGELDATLEQASMDIIGIDSECQCFYASSSKTNELKWPALGSQCSGHFSEYR